MCVCVFVCVCMCVCMYVRICIYKSNLLSVCKSLYQFLFEKIIHFLLYIHFQLSRTPIVHKCVFIGALYLYISGKMDKSNT